MDYRTQVCSQLAAVGREAWDALRAADDARRTRPGRSTSPLSPFLAYEFLAALESSGSVGGRSGWAPQHLLLKRRDRLVGAVPLYGKAHSYGEYVFDWAWANAYHQHGHAYYPKLVAAIPFTPVPGPRLLAIDGDAAAALADALLAHARASRHSSLHVLFPDEIDAAALAERGMMMRSGVQFHWSNPGYRDFDAYLASLTQSKRKKVRAERRKVAEAGVRCSVLAGAELTAAHWKLFYRCYANTYAEHGSTPYLKPRFFEELAATMPQHVALAVASDAHGAFASALLMRDAKRIYGRYWGSLRPVPFVHFETAYYAPIQWAIEHGIEVFEGGAQGEHKLARGFAPVKTCSAHWLAHPDFAQAVEQFLRRETQGVDAYLDELTERLPLRAPPCADDAGDAQPSGR